MVETQVLQTITEIGYPAGLVVFFVWLSWKREERMNSRIREAEDYIRNQLTVISEKTTQSIDENTVAFRQVIALVGDLTRVIRDVTGRENQ